MPAEESDPIPLDGKTPMSEAELILVRKLMREYSHWTWVKRRLFPFGLAIGAGVWGILQAFEWVVKHLPFVVKP
jgi:Zn-dependent protease